MDDALYSDLATRKKKNLTAAYATAAVSLSELAARNTPVSASEIIAAFNLDLRKILDGETAAQIAAGILALEGQLDQLRPLAAAEQIRQLPVMRDFYARLASPLLRLLAESDRNDDNAGFSSSLEAWKAAWKEALRVGVEEELYVWQNHTLEQ